MHYRRKPFSVEAVQVVVEKHVTTPDGIVKAKPGDWVVTEDNGNVNVCEDWVFRLKFEKAEPPGNPR
jgi:hypothetical protein